ncbi:TPA: acyltransferase [Kluyvera ascorbata]|uniref:Acyltransferase 3 domain-containing protein n=2 Tax=Kluyvera genomosp. 2 TaxID=2774054 RepID=A0A2T2Y736_9ENTR|nr:hypothetical protein C8256_04230 [Kluyvera genomosp. 2]HAT3917660.1 acyltransferase [Kluyvera ascorbata]HAT3942573.1 acyltransferase [Kluyvera ascorbata]HAT3946937.1 acyltransferase [Kluyvera ascorbata]
MTSANGQSLQQSALPYMSTGNDKIIFADQLRGLAFLCVVIIHWLGIYSVNPQFISMVTGAPFELVGDKAYYKSISTFLPFFNYGPFGVSLFFLISGFVIPFSIKKKSRFRFIASRLVRIYPTYIACSLMMLVIYTLSHLYWGSDPTIDYNRFWSNITLTFSMFNYGSLDYINWTLSIEIKFYILCAILCTFIRSGNGVAITATSLFITIFIFYTDHPASQQNPGDFSMDGVRIELLYVIYMMLGVLFHFLYMKKIRTLTFVFLSLITMSLFYFSWVYAIQHDRFPNEIFNYLYGFVVFALAFNFRNKFRHNVLLQLLSNISYPFYALHSVIGYCSIRYLESIGVGYLQAIVVTFTFVMLLSYLVHISIETQSIKLSKRI